MKAVLFELTEWICRLFRRNGAELAATPALNRKLFEYGCYACFVCEDEERENEMKDTCGEGWCICMRVCVYVSKPVKVTLPALIHGATLVLFTEETAESLMGRTVPHTHTRSHYPFHCSFTITTRLIFTRSFEKNKTFRLFSSWSDKSNLLPFFFSFPGLCGHKKTFFLINPCLTM